MLAFMEWLLLTACMVSYSMFRPSACIYMYSASESAQVYLVLVVQSMGCLCYTLPDDDQQARKSIVYTGLYFKS